MKKVIYIFLSVLLIGCQSTPIIQENNECSILPNIDISTVSDSYNKNRKVWKALNLKFKAHSKRKLVVFLDGTQNNGKDKTHIREMYLLSLKHACNDHPVIPYYDKGVGAKWFDGISGGITGQGIGVNIRQAYRFIVESYQPQDEIYIFGFSRGAYTARSLNGMLELAGLLDKKSVAKKDGEVSINDLKSKVAKIYKSYHVKKNDSIPLHTLVKQNIANYNELANTTLKTISIEGIGVFDTVAALGIKRVANPKRHHTNLYANHGFHALAIDEQRSDFELLRFNSNIKTNQLLKEVWFAGVHSNIGGGYDLTLACNTSHPEKKSYFDGLETTSLNWMLSNFKNNGIFPNNSVFNECRLGEMHDEYYDTWIPPYYFMGKYIRQIRETDLIHVSVKERMDTPLHSPYHKWRECTGKYRPSNITKPITSYTLVGR